MRRKWLRAWQRNESGERKLACNMTRIILPPVLAAGIFLISATGVYASPSGGQVVSGAGQIAQSGGNTTITQTSGKLGINWQDFNIAKGETVRFVQPGTNAVALNRVLGGNASAIYGTLSANGKVFLINPNGVLFAPGSQVNVGGIVASTMNMTDSDFQAGRYHLSGSGTGAVINQGDITASDGGYVALLGARAKNEGIITANQGTVVLAGGKAVTLDFTGNGLLQLAVDQKALDASAANSGLIQANSGQVVMTAGVANTLAGTVVNNSGVIKAQSAVNKNGVIILEGVGGNAVNSGTLDASSLVAGQTGGTIKVLGDNVSLTSTASLKASGLAGGGIILVGGNYQGSGSEQRAKTATVEQGATLAADAIRTGNGGQVVVWADGTTKFAGSISAKGGAAGGDGGSVETSGKQLKIEDTAKVVATAANGKTGSWLLDPNDFTIAASGGDMTGAALSAALGLADVTITTTNGNASVSSGAATNPNGFDGNGDINVKDNVSWAANKKLTLSAYRDVNINANISATGSSAGIIITPDNTSAGTGGYYLNGGAITLTGASSTVNIAGHDYTVIRSVEQLQGMNNNWNSNWNGYYFLGSDIDASVTSSWNDGDGFIPIGNGINYAGMFKGIFDGGGHTIKGLTINNNNPSSVVALFAGAAPHSTDARPTVFRNVGLADVNIVRRYNDRKSVAGLVGDARGEVIISNCYSTGVVKSLSTDTGLVGLNAVGGLVGTIVLNNGKGATINNSYSTCAVSNTVAGKVGGLLGYNSDGTISNSYSAGAVSGSGNVGGLVGGQSSGTVNNSFWNTETSGQSSSAGGLGKTTAEMMQQSTYTTGGSNWDFSNVWGIVDGTSYPYLKRQFSSAPQPTPPTPAIPGPTLVRYNNVLPAVLQSVFNAPGVAGGFGRSVGSSSGTSGNTYNFGLGTLGGVRGQSSPLFTIEGSGMNFGGSLNPAASEAGRPVDNTEAL